MGNKMLLQKRLVKCPPSAHSACSLVLRFKRTFVLKSINHILLRSFMPLLIVEWLFGLLLPVLGLCHRCLVAVLVLELWELGKDLDVLLCALMAFLKQSLKPWIMEGFFFKTSCHCMLKWVLSKKACVYILMLWMCYI